MLSRTSDRYRVVTYHNEFVTVNLEKIHGKTLAPKTIFHFATDMNI